MSFAAGDRLPTVLAGPIVRRAQPDRVYVWLATSEQLAAPALELSEVELGRGATTMRGLLNTQSQSVSFQMGQHFWIHLLGVRSSDRPLPVGVLLAYDIVEGGGGRRRLADLLPLSAITLPGLPAPTFTLQGDRAPLHLLYGSCRKMHGLGTDTAPALEQLLVGSARTPQRRPQTLLLGGDQIYADDVADLLIQHLNSLGAALLGRTESVPGVPEPGRLPLRGRKSLVKGSARFTSGHSHNHLLTFGEWAATYLLAWNPDLWPTRYPALFPSLQAMDPHERPNTTADWAFEHADQLNRLRDAQGGSATMRRVLANVATYMIFDDHEVTDDWNLNPAWTSKVNATPLGKHLLLNAMIAYWAFQGWGNEPMNFPSDAYRPLGQYTASGTGADAAEQLIMGDRVWDYIVPTSPRTVVVDTRTRRDKSGFTVDSRQGVLWPRNTAAPRLLGKTGRERTASLLHEARAHSRAAIMLMPSPVWGIDNVESVLGFAGFFKPDGVDLESWSANPRSRIDIMEMAVRASVRPLIVLSGDVHYGFSAAARLTTEQYDLLVAQFTSSATKNETGGGLELALRVLSVQLPSPAAQRFTWTRRGDGSITTVEIDPLRDAAIPALGVANAALLAAVGATEGPPAWTERSEYYPVANLVGGSVPLVSDISLRRNNVGELWVAGDVIRHNHWNIQGGRLHNLTSTDLSVGAWPV